MGMSVGSNGGQKAEINVTPMIDVLLVLIIIFLVITPIASRGLNALVPQQAKSDDTPAPARHDIVISVAANGQVSLNQEPMDLATLHSRLLALFKTGASTVVFVRGEKDLPFAEVAQVIDIARGAGVDRIGLMTRSGIAAPRPFDLQCRTYGRALPWGVRANRAPRDPAAGR